MVSCVVSARKWTTYFLMAVAGARRCQRRDSASRSCCCWPGKLTIMTMTINAITVVVGGGGDGVGASVVAAA